jgi:hypothetical protein
MTLIHDTKRAFMTVNSRLDIYIIKKRYSLVGYKGHEMMLKALPLLLLLPALWLPPPQASCSIRATGKSSNLLAIRVNALSFRKLIKERNPCLAS